MSVFYPNCVGLFSVVFDGFGEDSKPTFVPFLPRSATVHLNGYHDADTFEIEIDAKVLPFSPELLRSVAVELYMFETNGLLTKAIETHKEGGEDRWNFSQFQTEDNRLMIGLVDDASLHYGEDGRTVRMQGRDYTGLLLGRDWDPRDRIPVGKDLRATVQDMVDKCLGHDVGKNKLTLDVVYKDSSEVSTQANAQNAAKKETVVKPSPTTGSKHSKTKKKGFTTGSGKTYWDVIYDLCVRHAKICFVRGREVVISDPHTLTQERLDKSVKMAWGRNLKFLDISRRMGREAVPQLIASMYSAKAKAAVTVEYPKDSDLRPTVGNSKQKGRQALQITGANTLREETRRVILDQSITDEDLARQYLKAQYDTLARTEATVRFETAFLKDFRTPEEGDPRSLLALRAGDAVRISFDAFVNEDLKQLSQNQRYSRLRQLGYAEGVAATVAENYERLARIQAPLYVRDMSVAWSIESGIRVTVEGVNYIFPARDDRTPTDTYYKRLNTDPTTGQIIGTG